MVITYKFYFFVGFLCPFIIDIYVACINTEAMRGAGPKTVNATGYGLDASPMK